MLRLRPRRQNLHGRGELSNRMHVGCSLRYSQRSGLRSSGYRGPVQGLRATHHGRHRVQRGCAMYHGPSVLHDLQQALLSAGKQVPKAVHPIGRLQYREQRDLLYDAEDQRNEPLGGRPVRQSKLHDVSHRLHPVERLQHGRGRALL